MNSTAPKPIEPQEKFDPSITKHLYKAGFLLLILCVMVVLVGIYFESQLLLFAQWVVEHFGFAGMAIILFVTDTLIMPFPPDLLLIIIAKSDLHSQWPLYVGALGVISTVCGVLGWCIGRWLGHFKWAHRFFDSLQDSQKDFVRRNGALAVVIGALTPIPFSVTCWTAGLMKIPLSSTALASMLRVPRFVFYYIVIYYSVTLTELIRNNLF